MKKINSNICPEHGKMDLHNKQKRILFKGVMVEYEGTIWECNECDNYFVSVEQKNNAMKEIWAKYSELSQIKNSRVPREEFKGLELL